MGEKLWNSLGVKPKNPVEFLRDKHVSNVILEGLAYFQRISLRVKAFSVDFFRGVDIFNGFL